MPPFPQSRPPPPRQEPEPFASSQEEQGPPAPGSFKARFAGAGTDNSPKEKVKQWLLSKYARKTNRERSEAGHGDTPCT